MESEEEVVEVEAAKAVSKMKSTLRALALKPILSQKESTLQQMITRQQITARATITHMNQKHTKITITAPTLRSNHTIMLQTMLH